MAAGRLVAGVLTLAVAGGCGSWIVHEAQNPKGGVMGYKRYHRAMADMQAYCGGPFQVVSQWDAPPTDGPVNYTIGGRNHTAFLQAGYYYFAFVCGAGNDMPGVQGDREPQVWDGEGPRREAPGGSRARGDEGHAGGGEGAARASAQEAEAFQAALDADENAQAFARCRAGQARVGDLPPGQIVLRVTINPSGEVAEVSLALHSSRYSGTYLASCLTSAIWNANFPPPARDWPVTFDVQIPIR